VAGTGAVTGADINTFSFSLGGPLIGTDLFLSPPILNLLPMELPVPTTVEIDISFSHGLLDFSIIFGMRVSSLGVSSGFFASGHVYIYIYI
jgi:hypothetical protein